MQMLSVNEVLHDLESQLIQIYGLMQALQEIIPDGNAHVCVANELEKRLSDFKSSFDDGWDVLSKR
ncbi:hypothetical protein [Kordia sp. SMS9]|uniref:hypothetical protein n=1 Tax=Kordia sp. SMS9 TaxID=2282170 RepID=UPI000E0D4BA0|nr:hypothetical protein [Kordia sp. SMS9]